MLIHNEFKPYMAQKEETKRQVVEGNKRLSWLMLAIGGAFCVLVGHSFRVQAQHHSELSKFSENRAARHDYRSQRRDLGGESLFESGDV